MQRFTLKRKEVEVEIEHEDGVVHVYTIRELSGTGRDSYLSSMAGKFKFDENGKPSGVKDFNGLQASLLARCLFRDEALVPEKVIQEFPSSTVEGLFDVAQEVSALSKIGEQAAKGN